MNQKEIQQRIFLLEQELASLKLQVADTVGPNTVSVPETYQSVFRQAEKTVRDYFFHLDFSPEKGMIEVDNERYVLIRASSLAFDFFHYLKNMYTDRNDHAAFQSGQDFLFDIGHILGLQDARFFQQKMKLEDPIQKLSAGPVHFAYSGWASVTILEESNPSPDENFFIKYHHPYSFEADTWLANAQQSHDSVCIMNAGYSSGWCEESFGIPLTAIEISCRAKGDENCTFIMAPPHKIQNYLKLENQFQSKIQALPPNPPLFFNRKMSEDQIKASLKEKEIMLQEIHHRVKNNLQVIVSLMGLQIHLLKDLNAAEAIRQTQYRIESIAMIHEMLYTAKDLGNIDYSHYLERLIPSIVSSLYHSPQKIRFKKEIAKIYFNLDTAIPIGLIITELVTNSLKYGFKNQSNPLICIEMKEIATGNFILNYSDNGSGLSSEETLSKPSTLGLMLVKNLVKQLNGKIKITNQNGLHFNISFYQKD